MMSKRTANKAPDQDGAFSTKEKPFNGHRFGHKVLASRELKRTSAVTATGCGRGVDRQVLDDITKRDKMRDASNFLSSRQSQNKGKGHLSLKQTSGKTSGSTRGKETLGEDIDEDSYDEEEEAEAEDNENEDTGRHPDLVECDADRVSGYSSIAGSAQVVPSRYDNYCEVVGMKDSDTIFQETVKSTTRKMGWKYYKMVDETDYHYQSEFASYMMHVLGSKEEEFPSLKHKENAWARYKRHICEGMQAARSSATQALKKQFFGT
jgi:hypothetical protein